MTTLVLGLGNLLLRDEGFGVRVVQRLQGTYVLPEGVAVLDGGTLGLNLLAELEGAERVVIVDALRAGQAPGTLLRLSGGEIPAYLAVKVSPHQIGLQDLLALAQLRGHTPAEIVLWGVEAEQVEPGLDLSPPVAAQVEPAIARVLGELERWGVVAGPICAA